MREFNYLIVPLSTRKLTKEDQDLILRVQREHGSERVHDVISQISDFKLPDHDIDLLVLLILSGGVSRTATQIQLQVKAPTLVLCHGEENSLPSALGLLERRLVNLPILVLLYKRSNVDSAVQDLRLAIHACRAAYKTFHAKLAVLFERELRSEWIELLRRTRLKIVLVKDLKLDVSSYENFVKSLEEGILRVVESHSAQGVTFDCFNLLRKLALTPCLAFARLLARGIPVACECDLAALLGQVLLREISSELLRKSMIVNLVDFDEENGLATVAHCTAPVTIGERWELDRHFETGYLSGVKAYVPRGARCTLFRFSSDFKSIFISTGTVVKNSADLESLRACLTKAQIKLDFNIESNALLGNHHILVLDESASTYLKIAAWYLNLKTVGVKLGQVMRSPLLRSDDAEQH